MPVSFRDPNGTSTPAAGLDPMLHRLGQSVGKRLIQRHRQANVAIDHEVLYMKPNCSAGSLKYP